MKSFTYLCVFTVLIFTLSAFAIPDARATSITISDESSCKALTGGDLNSVWIEDQHFCTAPDGLKIKSGETLTIPSGITLLTDGRIYNEGTIIINGNITNGGGFLNSGTITNSGGITILYGSTSTLINDGTITNSGTINNQADFTNGNCTLDHFGCPPSEVTSGTINNSGIIQNECYGTYYGNPPSGNPVEDKCTTASPTTTAPAPADNATVPEFGPVASIVLAIAVLSMVVFAAKTRIIPKF